MCAGQIAQTHQKLVDDLAAGEAESIAEQLDPFFFVERVVRVEPIGEGAVAFPQHLEPARIVDGGVDLEAVADDAGIGEEPFAVTLVEGGDLVDVEAGEGLGESLALPEDGEPGEPGLVDLQDQPLEQHAVVARGKPVLAGVIGPVQGVTGRSRAIGRAHDGRKLTRLARIAAKSPSQMRPAIAVVTAALSTRRGLAGAPAAWPGSPTGVGRTPQGSTANSTSHQMTT